MPRILKVLAVVALLSVVAAPTAAFAQTYPIQEDTATVSATSVEPGEPVAMGGSGYAADVLVTITFESTPVVVGTTTTDDSGSFSTTVEIPQDASPGWHHLRASGLDADGVSTRVLSVAVFVEGAGSTGGAAGSGGGRLPKTGASTTVPLGQAGFAALAIGAGLVVVARKRRQAAELETVSTDA